MLRLFLATSIKQEGTLESFYLWFRVRRMRPVGSYDQLICRYDAMDDEERVETENLVDMLLTQDEVEDLYEYLFYCRGLEPYIMEIPVPVDFDLFHFPELQGSYTVYDLWKDDESAVPFPVRAFCTKELLPESLEEELAPQD
jgi:hypothetical protein